MIRYLKSLSAFGKRSESFDPVLEVPPTADMIGTESEENSSYDEDPMLNNISFEQMENEPPEAELKNEDPEDLDAVGIEIPSRWNTW